MLPDPRVVKFIEAAKEQGFPWEDVRAKLYAHFRERYPSEFGKIIANNAANRLMDDYWREEDSGQDEMLLSLEANV